MKPYTIHDCEQRSAAWFAARCGRLTASDAKEALSTVKSGESVGRKKIRTKIAVERLIGVYQDDPYINAAMARGIELEPDARAAYEAHTGILVETCGFVAHNDLPIGCSPDGIIDGLTGGLELKVPLLHTHVGLLRGKSAVPWDYVPQVMHSLLVTDAEWWDFASFAPELPDRLRLFYVRVNRADVDLMSYQADVEAFLSEVETETQALRTMANLPAVLAEVAALA